MFPKNVRKDSFFFYTFAYTCKDIRIVFVIIKVTTVYYITLNCSNQWQHLHPAFSFGYKEKFGCVMMSETDDYVRKYDCFSVLRGNPLPKALVARVRMNVELVAAVSQYITVNAGPLPWLLHEDDGL